MGLAPVDRRITDSPSTGGVDGFDCTPLTVGGCPVLAADVYRHPSAIENDPSDYSITHHAS
jgi:hypothetical protein